MTVYIFLLPWIRMLNPDPDDPRIRIRTPESGSGPLLSGTYLTAGRMVVHKRGGAGHRELVEVRHTREPDEPAI